MRRIEFEEFISEISARFIDLSAELIDAEIDKTLMRALDFFQGDRCGLLYTSDDRQFWTLTHIAVAEGTASLPANVQFPVAIFPWVAKRLLEQREINYAPSMKGLPADAAVDRESWENWSVKSTLDIPILVGDSIDYIFSIQTTTVEHEWPVEFFPRIRLLGEIFVSAIQKKQKDQTIKEMVHFERFISELSASLVSCEHEHLNLQIRECLLRLTHFSIFDSVVYREFTQEGDKVLASASFQKDSGAALSKEVINFPYENFPPRGNSIADVIAYRVDTLPQEWEFLRDELQARGIDCLLVCPLKVDEVLLGACILFSNVGRLTSSGGIILRVRTIMSVLANALHRNRMDRSLRNKLKEVGELKKQLERENTYLKSEVRLYSEGTEIIGKSPAIRKTLNLAHHVAPTESTVLLLGETGTGKELVAQTIHRLSRRGDRLMVRVNCASLPAELVESELFGREKGAYTGALTRQIGRFELADQSTILLDEIGELHFTLQAKLLRVLENGEFQRLGSPHTIRVNVRIIAATNRNLADAVESGKFRQDLYYRLKVFPIEIPPLRERVEDITLMARAFLSEFSLKMGKEINDFSAGALKLLQAYSWPGNVRELRSVIEQAVIMCDGPHMELSIPPMQSITAALSASQLSLEEMERRYILAALHDCMWRIKGNEGAAKRLGLKPSTLYAKMEKLGIRNPEKKVSLSVVAPPSRIS